ncbi:MAG: tetratricopeptide repeat protein [Tenuifilaceae bacterium]
MNPRQFIFKLNLFALVALLFITISSKSQNVNSINEYLKDSKIDTSLLKEFIIIIQKQVNIGSHKSDSLANRILIQSNEKRYPNGIALVFRYQGLALFNKGNLRTSVSNHRKALEIFTEQNDSTYIVFTNQSLAITYFNIGLQDSAIHFCIKAIKSFRYREDLKNLASCYNTLGGIYWAKGEYSKAADEFFESLKIKEQQKDSIGIANTYNNIGILYDDQQKLTEALEMYQKSLEIYQKKRSKRGISKATNNIAITLKNLNRCGEAIEMLLRSLEIDKELGSKNEQGKTLNNIGQLYLQINEPAKAIDYLNEAKRIFNESEDISSKIATNINLGRAYLALENFEKANNYFSNSLIDAKNNNALEWIKESHLYLYQLNKKIRNSNSALFHFEKYTTISDSLRSIENLNRLDELKLQFETSQKEKEIVILNKENDLKNLEIKRQKSISWFFILISGFTLFVTFLIGYGWLIIRKDNKNLVYKNIEIYQQKEEIETQKDLLESLNSKLNIQNKEIEDQFDQVESLNIELNQQTEEILAQRDQIEDKNRIISATNRRMTENIEYASRIQKALLPDLGIVKGFFSNQSILYKPKDIVSGDFYWMWPFEDKICFSVADCTGHGVSGAFMSILAYNFLKDSIITHGLCSPKDIISFINNEVENNLYSNLPSHEIKDGMDIIVCFYYPKQNLLEYSGAHSSFLHLRNGIVTNYKTDRYSIGTRVKNTISFSDNQLYLKKGDRLVFHTDGYIDQLDGINRKKIGRNALSSLIETTHHLDIESQILETNKYLLNWMGDSEQIDDILIWALEV